MHWGWHFASGCNLKESHHRSWNDNHTGTPGNHGAAQAVPLECLYIEKVSVKKLKQTIKDRKASK